MYQCFISFKDDERLCSIVIVLDTSPKPLRNSIKDMIEFIF